MSPPSSPPAGDVAGPAPADGDIAGRLRLLEHAMRTPLGTLTAALELLKLPAGPDGMTGALQVMERQVRQLTTQLEQLHDISRDLSDLAGERP